MTETVVNWNETDISHVLKNLLEKNYVDSKSNGTYPSLMDKYHRLCNSAYFKNINEIGNEESVGIGGKTHQYIKYTIENEKQIGLVASKIASEISTISDGFEIVDINISSKGYISIAVHSGKYIRK